MQNLAQVFIEQLKSAEVEEQAAATRYLVVDDNSEFGSCMKDMLGFCKPCKVDVVDSPEKAFSSVAKTIPYSRVFLDLNFPGKESGVMAMKRIKSIMPNTPITIISGAINDGFDEFEKEAKKQGVSVLKKGFTINSLLEML